MTDCATEHPLRSFSEKNIFVSVVWLTRETTTFKSVNMLFVNYRGGEEVRKAIVYVVQNQKKNIFTNGQFSGHLIFDKKYFYYSDEQEFYFKKKKSFFFLLEMFFRKIFFQNFKKCSAHNKYECFFFNFFEKTFPKKTIFFQIKKKEKYFFSKKKTKVLVYRSKKSFFSEKRIIFL